MFKRIARRWFEYSDGEWRKQDKIISPSGVEGEIGPSVSFWAHEEAPRQTGNITPWVDL